MSVRATITIVILGLWVLFAAVNWSTLMTPSHLSLVVTTVDAPLGLILFCFAAAVGALALAHSLKVQFNALTDNRKQAAELRRQRELADEAEASRLTELKKFVEVEFASLRQAQQADAAQIREEITAMTNTIAACVGEIDERLERQSPTSQKQLP